MHNNSPTAVVAPASLARKFETSDRNPRNVLIIAGGAAVLVFFALIVAGVTIGFFSQRRPMQRMEPLGIIAAPNQQPLTRFAKPNLDVDDDRTEMLTLRAAQIAQLNSYGWVNRSNGIVHIPIERAMELVLPRLLTNSSPGDSPVQLIQKISQQP